MNTWCWVSLATTIVIAAVVTLGVAAQTRQDLVLYYACDEGTGKTVTDLSGNGNDGTIHGAKWADGNFNQGLEFNGTDNYVDCGASKSLQLQQELTLAVWVNLAIPPSQMHSDSRIIARENSGAGAPWASYALTVNGNATGCFGFEISADTPDIYPKSTTVPEVAVWYHLAGVYDGSKCDLYLNGQLEGSLPQSGDLVINPALNPMVGADVNRNIEYFHGLIDEVVIYQRVLSDTEIQALVAKPLTDLMSVAPEGQLATIWSRIKSQ
jgi:hypothetical protein